MFEKSLYDLIKGLRQHKGNEKDFIEHSLRECRQEIKGADMDLKATALLKLVYLEMFGHDMSWAAFNVLEVMSAQRHHQKRIGYLGAVQTFGPNTDVLMLATNLLKKDVTSSTQSVISLPLTTIPHLTTPGLANAVVPDILARVSHSSPNIRKKSIVTLYRLALVWPEALRPAWPKMKDILENDDEDPSVTATVVNVVCELVWRRPEDFLPLAPRFFELLVQGENNWMAIKLIKLFATLTPLEPRLIKKLAPALTNLINTTPAMSVLYECVNGIIQGGILDGAQGIREGDEIAELCVGKLCSMIAVEGDPNLKYVALLAFNKIVLSHPQLVSAQQDSIASCLDDSDVSIRIQALTLVSRMVDQDNLVPMVARLLQQLESNRPLHQLDPGKDSIEDQMEMKDRLSKPANDFREYGVSIVQKIIEMCSVNLYSNVTDFDWYIDVLTHLIQLAPIATKSDVSAQMENAKVYDTIGFELRNIAIRVKSSRLHAVESASSLISSLKQEDIVKVSGHGAYSVLGYAAFIIGEFPGLLPDPHVALNSLILRFQQSLEAQVLVSFLQALAKILSFIFRSELTIWDNHKRSEIELLLARVISTIESYSLHASIEVQECAVTLLELTRLAEAALSKHAADELTAPTLVRDILPSLFTGQELNPVAMSAQQKVPVPFNLDLDAPINQNLMSILLNTDEGGSSQAMPASSAFYYNREQEAIPVRATVTASGQLSGYPSREEQGLGPGISAKMTTEDFQRQERNLHDPFYIGSDRNQSRAGTNPMHDILQDSNGQAFDIDSIPIMELDLGASASGRSDLRKLMKKGTSKKSKTKVRADIAGDETYDTPEEISRSGSQQTPAKPIKRSKITKTLLQVDSSNIGSLSSSPGTGASAGVLHQRLGSGSSGIGGGAGGPDTMATLIDHESEMKKALAEVERLRLEMQRAQDRVAIADDIPQEGTLITKKKTKKKKKTTSTAETGMTAMETGTAKDAGMEQEEEVVVVKKKKSSGGKKKEGKKAKGKALREEVLTTPRETSQPEEPGVGYQA